MTREKAIEMLEYIRYTGNGESEYKNCVQGVALDMAIKALEQRWIPVTERLPEVDVDVFVTDNGGGVPTVTMDACGMKDDTGERFWYISQTPIAWIPLPEPYKAESEGG